VPFGNPVPRNFTAVAVNAEAPAGGGVYGLSNARQWLYIGTSDNIRQALSARLQERDTLLARNRPMGFVYEICDAAVRDGRCRRLISEYAPLCNGSGADSAEPGRNRT